MKDHVLFLELEIDSGPVGGVGWSILLDLPGPFGNVAFDESVPYFGAFKGNVWGVLLDGFLDRGRSTVSKWRWNRGCAAQPE